MAQHGSTLTTTFGIPLEVRPLAPADREALADAFARLSDRSRTQRFLGPKPRLSAAELTYLTEIDHRSHEAIVAFDPSDGRLVGVVRYVATLDDPATADFAFTVADAWQGQGIATMLTSRLLARAEENGIERLTAVTFVDNRPARATLRRHGFRTTYIGDGVVELALDVPVTATRPRAPA